MFFISAAKMVIAVSVLTGQFSLIRLDLNKKQAEIGTAPDLIELLAVHNMLTQRPNGQHKSELSAAPLFVDDVDHTFQQS